MPIKQRILWILVTIAIAVLVVFFSFRTVNLTDALYQIQRTNYWWLFAAVLMMIIYFILMGWVIQIIDDHQNKITLKDAVRVGLMEQFGNGVTPLAIGGQPMQLLGLSQSGVSIGEATSISATKFIIYQLTIVIAFLVSLVFGYHFVAQHLQAMSLLVIFGVVIHFVVLGILLTVMFSPKLTSFLARNLFRIFGWFIGSQRSNAYLDKTQTRIDEFHEVSRQIFSKPKLLFNSTLVTLLLLSVYYSIPFFVLNAFHVANINFWFIFVLNIILTLVISIFPIPGGSGGAEIGFSLLFSTYIQDNATLVLAMLIWRLLTYYFGLFSGLVAYNFATDYSRRQGS